MKEEGDDMYKQFNERITNIERKILDMDEKYENRSEVIKREHVDENQGKTVITGFHSETTESANMLKKELRGRNIKITRSMDAEERFHNKRMGYVKNSIHMRQNIPLSLISLNWTSKYVSVKGQIVVKKCQSGSLKYIKYQDVEDEVEEQLQKWQTKNSSQRL